MKKILLIAAIGLAAALSYAGQFQLINGYSYTNPTVYMNGVTNQYGVVATTATNYYNLPVMSGGVNSSGLIQSSQQNTNLWPSVGVSLTGYPNTLYAPANNVLLDNLVNLTSTNSTSTPILVRYAGYDGNIWVSNVWQSVVTIAVNTTQAQTITNINTVGWQAIALQEVDNPGATGAVTNHISDAADKPGF